MDSITDVEGFEVGHAHDLELCTGCTVVLCPDGGARAAAVVRGLASGTRQLGIADPMHSVERVNAIFLAGGSAFGLDAAAGVMTYLRENGRGFSTAHAKIPIVPTAILYDVGVGSATAHPTAEMAYAACERASAQSVEEGSVGVGAGASVGKLLSVRCATKGGLGMASTTTEEGLTVAALAAVNAFGDVVDSRRRRIVAGARRAPESFELIDMNRQICAGKMPTSFGGSSNTTLVVMATNASLKGQSLRRVASWSADGLVDVLRPAFTAVDGDVLIALSTDDIPAEPHRIGLLGQTVVKRAVLRAVESATSLGGLPVCRDLEPRPY